MTVVVQGCLVAMCLRLSLGDGQAEDAPIIDLCDPINDEEEDAALKARRKLGVPEYDPDSLVVTTLPKIMPLDSHCKDRMYQGVRCRVSGVFHHVVPL